jgi:copper chaperone CopZ
MSCGHCLNAVNKALGAVSGIELRSVAIGRASFGLPESGSSSVDDAVTAVEEAGYNVTLVDSAT